jgi:hypothetical protein
MTCRTSALWSSLLAAFLVSAPARPFGPPHIETKDELEAKIQQEQNPIKRAKLQIKLFHIDLQQAVNAYDAQDQDQGEKDLAAYQDEVKECWKTLQSSGEIAARHSAGFKEFDIALRENLRRLTDLSHRVSYLSGGKIRDVISEVQEIRNENLVALFPSFNKKKQSEKSASQSPGVHPVPHSKSQ